MTRLSAAQIAGYAAGAGFKGQALTNAVAVALAESGGDPRAVGVNSDRHRSRDRGLWQINDYWHRNVSDAQAFDPAAAARHAFRISKGGRDWSPWTTWPAAATAQMPKARIGVAQAQRAGGGRVQPVVGNGAPPIPPGLLPGDPADVLPDVPGLPDPGDLADVGRVLVRAGAWAADAHNWQRVAMVVGGVGGILLALTMIAKSGAAGETVQNLTALPAKARNAAVGAVGMAAAAPVKAGKAAAAVAASAAK